MTRFFPLLATRTIVACVIAFSMDVASSAAQGTAEATLDRYLEVTGGREAHLRWQTRITRGTQLIKSADTLNLVSIYETNSTRRLWVSRSEVMGEIREGSQKGIAWSDGLIAGPRLKQGGELAYALRSAPIDAAARWREYFEKVSDLGEMDLEGTPCRVVELQPKEGKPERRYYSVESGLLVRAELELSIDGNPVPGSITYDDYRKVDDLLLPHTIIETQGELSHVTLRIEQIDHHTPIDAATLEPPEEIRALLER